MKNVQSITINPSCIQMIKGNWYYDICAQVLPTDADNKCVVWCSDNPYVASVIEELGYICANHAGTAKIYATATDGSCVSAYCTVTVEDRVPVSSVNLNASKITLGKGEYWRARATVSPENAYNKSVEWCSSNRYVADVDAYGFVTAKSVGTAYIYATARDGSGARGQCSVTVRQTVTYGAEETPRSRVSVNSLSVPIDVYSGAHKLKHTVMQLFGGQNLSFEIRYDSTNLAKGDVGAGWYHNYEKHIELSDNTALVYMSPSIYSRYTAKSDCCCEFTCASPNKNGYVLTVDMSRTYPYIIDCNKQRTEYYDCEGRLAKVVDRHGFETLISYSDNLITVTDCVSGKHIFIEKSTCCKINRVYDDASRQAYFSYDNDALTTFTNVNGGNFRYTYDSVRRILNGTDPEGTVYFRNTYDSYGRLSQQQDGEGNIFVFSYACDTRGITDRNGKTSRQEFNGKGLLVKSTDANNCVTKYEYDDRYNVIKETDGRGYSTKTEYNSFNKPTKITDKNGNVTTFEYDGAGNVKNITYPKIADKPSVEHYEYNGRNQITKHTDLRGMVTTYTYDSVGMPKTKKVGDRPAVEYTYTNGLLVSQKDARGYSTTYVHDAVGRVYQATDADNHTTTYTYDNMGNVRTIVDANQKTVTTTYYKNGLKSSFTDANGNKTEYFYNGNMKNDEVKLPDNNYIKYEFDGEDRIRKVIDQKGNVSETVYDDGGRVKSRKAADGATVQYEYDKCGNVKKETNPMGATVEMTYDGMGNVLTAKDSEGNITSYEYNEQSKPVRVSAPNGAIICYEYNEAGDRVSETDAFNNKKTYQYDKYGNLLNMTDARKNSTSYTYDANNNLLTVKNALDETVTYTYNCLNQCSAMTDAKQRSVGYEYDALGRRTKVTDARGNTFETQYDACGNVLKTFDADGALLTDTTYNNLNLPQTFTDATGKSLSYLYNELGKIQNVSDALGHDQSYGYDACGRNTSVSEENYGTSSAEYDLFGNVKKLRCPRGATTSYTYDNRGRLISQSTTSGGAVSYQYNELSLRKKLTNARGQNINFLYDAMGRISVYVTPEGAVSLDYDDNGNVVRTRDKQGDITRTFDKLNRVTSYTDTCGKTISYEYDEVGDLRKIIYPDGTAVNYEYDENHNLVKVTDWSNRVTEYTYDKNNRVIGIVKPNGTVVSTTYEKNKVKSTVEKTAQGQVITGFEYTYDNLSRVIEEKVLANSTKMCYTYDELSRVTKRTIKDLNDTVLSEESFSYDLAGNITGGSASTTFAYDTNNRLVTFNGQSVSYDTDGNMTYGNNTCCEYDSLNRLISAGAHDYIYNAENVRIRNLCTDEDTSYVYDTNCKLSQLLMKTTNNAVTKYVYGLGLIGEETNNIFKTYHFDSRGSTIAITDINGNVTDTFAYDTYGKRTVLSGTSDVIFGYNGRDGVVTDKNGLIYMRARYYSPEMRRFINADIVAGKINNAVTLNRYAYANGNPVSFVDPFGLSAWDWIKDKYNKAKDWVEEKIVNPIVNNVIEPTLDAGAKAFDYIATDFGKDVVNVISKSKEKLSNSFSKRTVVNTKNGNKLTKSYVIAKLNEDREFIIDKCKSIYNAATESFTFDFGFGAGIGGELDVDQASIGAVVREDFITIKKDSGNSHIEIGKRSEEYHGVEAMGGFIGDGRERFTEFGADEYGAETSIEPHQDLTVGSGIKAYFGLGITFSIGFDIDHFLEKVILP